MNLFRFVARYAPYVNFTPLRTPAGDRSERVSGKNAGAQRIQFGLQLLEPGQLPAAIGSPVTAIEQDDSVFRADPVRQIDGSARDERNREFRERLADPQLLGHRVLLFRQLRFDQRQDRRIRSLMQQEQVDTRTSRQPQSRALPDLHQLS